MLTADQLNDIARDAESAHTALVLCGVGPASPLHKLANHVDALFAHCKEMAETIIKLQEMRVEAREMIGKLSAEVERLQAIVKMYDDGVIGAIAKLDASSRRGKPPC